MTREEWEGIWASEFRRLRTQFPTADLIILQKAARKYVEGKHGPQPPKAPLAVRVGLAVARHKLKEAHMSPMAYRLLNTFLFFIGAVAAAVQLSGMPHTPEAWGAVIIPALMAAYGKFSSNQTFIAPNRPTWTDEQRANGGK